MKSLWPLACLLLGFSLCNFLVIGNGKVEIESPDVIYPKYRMQPTPAFGEAARFNPPSLQWPAGKQQTYGVRLSLTKDFSEIYFEKEDIPFAIANPHQVLSPGTWYWQTRTQNEEWGPVDSFLISPATKLFATPAIDRLVANIPREHPRVLLHHADWDAFRKRAASYQESRDIIAKAERFLSSTPPKEKDGRAEKEGETEHQKNKLALMASRDLGNEVGEVLNALSQAYALTKDRRYFVVAKSWMLEIATWDPKGVTRLNNFGDSNIMLAMAQGVDIFWDLLSAEERAQVINQAAARARQFYKLWINNIEAKSTSMHVWQHILHRMIQTSVALMHEVPDAKVWLAYLYELWIAQNPKMGETDGAWFNGTGYVRMNILSMLDIPAIFQEYTGVDFLWSDWYQNFPIWMNYAFPPTAIPDGFCNDGDKYAHPTIEYAGFSDAFARVSGSPYAAWYAKRILQNLEVPLSDDEAFRWFRIQRGYQMELPEPLPILDLPQAAVFPEVGVAYMNTELGDPANNLRLSIRSSPFGPQGHTHADQNTFNIAYGGQRLFYNSGYRAAMGDPHFLAWYKHTQGHNGILIDGQGQPFDAGAYGQIPRFLQGREIAYAVGDASKAYSAGDLDDLDLGLKRFRRHYLMLPPSTIIIYDDLEADHSAEWSWLLHHDKGLQVDAEKQTIIGENDLAAGRVTLLSSTPLDFQLTDQFSVQPENFTNKVDGDGEVIDFVDQWHFKGVSKEKTRTMRYLAIIQVTPDKSFTPIVLESQKGDYRVGEWLITAQMDANEPALIQAKNTDGTAAFTSRGMLPISDKMYRGKSVESAKLLENTHGKIEFQEQSDTLPAAVLKARYKE